MLKYICIGVMMGITLQGKYIDSFEVKPEVDKYPQQQAVSAEYIKVSEGHELYVECYGKEGGVPVVTLHGGPGFGSNAGFSRYFDLDFYKVIVFDQRGAKRSKPFGEVRANNPQELVKDMEVIRNHFGIDKWLVFGGSWGSTLSLLYGETHPERCLGFVLRGIFFGTNDEVNNLLYGMRSTYPEFWDEMVEMIPEKEREDLLEAAYSRMMSEDKDKALFFGRAFLKYDVGGASIAPNYEIIEELTSDDKVALGVPKIFFHFAKNRFFLKENQLANNLDRITHLPCYIVHGRHDTITKVQKGYELHKMWPGSKLYIAEMSGHTAVEPEIERGLTAATDELKSILSL